jgi:translation initiation factor 2B subunit (eIF-2B alpha/beta/delta family)
VDKVDVVNPYHDYVRPELVDAFITNEWVTKEFLWIAIQHTTQQWRPSAVIHI